MYFVGLILRQGLPLLEFATVNGIKLSVFFVYLAVKILPQGSRLSTPLTERNVYKEHFQTISSINDIIPSFRALRL